MKKLLLICMFYMLFIPTHATHYMGGEITWECLPNGNYRFILKLYRECYTSNGGSAATFGATETMYSTVPGLPSITMTRILQTDMSPVCNPSPDFQPKIFCPGLANGAANMGALQLNLYTSDASYPNGVTLIGTPPAQGWEFSSRTCCRNPCTNIINASSLGFRLRAYMYSFNGQNASPCFDSSPVFAEIPHSIMCSGFPTTFNYAASDPDFDGLTYDLVPPLLENGVPITAFASGYSFSSPLPGTVHNPNNVPASINQQTGEISFTSYTQGAFVTVVKVTSYRCGQKISEIFREVQIVLKECGNNNPPEVSAPFQDPQTLLFTSYTDTVYAGQLVSFSIEGLDFDFMPDNTTPQTLKLLASGLQFGQSFTNPNAGCLIPPCATLNPPPPVTSNFSVATNFTWQTTIDHLVINNQCPSNETVYRFQFQIGDDYCPVPAFTAKIVTIVVRNEHIVSAPEIRCIETLDNGSIELHWTAPANPALNFDSYHIYYSSDPNGPFQKIDSIFDISITSALHINVNGNQQDAYYYLKSRSGLGGVFYSPPSQTVRNIILQADIAATNTVTLVWNPNANPPIPTNSSYYDVFRDDGTGSFNYLHSTLNTSITDQISGTGEKRYKIEKSDASGCHTVSNVVQQIYLDIQEFDGQFAIFPNPFSDEFTICSMNTVQSSFAEITDITGKVLLRREWTDKDCLTISGHNLPRGMYFLRAGNQTGRYFKIIRID
jgi:hypothetical protein